MIDPDFVLQLTPLNAKNEENLLELDPERVIGWLGYQQGTMIIIDGPHGHSNFSVKEDVPTVRTKMAEIRDSMKLASIVSQKILARQVDS